jgi:hypothetical protein
VVHLVHFYTGMNLLFNSYLLVFILCIVKQESSEFVEKSDVRKNLTTCQQDVFATGL